YVHTCAPRTMFVRFGRGLKVRANGARTSRTTIHSLSVFSTNTLMVRCLDVDRYLRGSLFSVHTYYLSKLLPYYGGSLKLIISMNITHAAPFVFAARICVLQPVPKSPLWNVEGLPYHVWNMVMELIQKIHLPFLS
ncbi:hypothetical protein L9F63_008215, partial [Diploptera punctata]